MFACCSSNKLKAAVLHSFHCLYSNNQVTYLPEDSLEYRFVQTFCCWQQMETQNVKIEHYFWRKQKHESVS